MFWSIKCSLKSKRWCVKNHYFLLFFVANALDLKTLFWFFFFECSSFGYFLYFFLLLFRKSRLCVLVVASCFFLLVCLLSFFFFLFFGGLKGQLRWPEGPPHLALIPPYYYFDIFCFGGFIFFFHFCLQETKTMLAPLK